MNEMSLELNTNNNPNSHKKWATIASAALVGSAIGSLSLLSSRGKADNSQELAVSAVDPSGNFDWRPVCVDGDEQLEVENINDLNENQNFTRTLLILPDQFIVDLAPREVIVYNPLNDALTGTLGEEADNTDFANFDISGACDVKPELPVETTTTTTTIVEISTPPTTLAEVPVSVTPTTTDSTQPPVPQTTIMISQELPGTE